jgi:hypothetical protein
MKTYKEITKKEKIIDNIYCTKCGKDIKISDLVSKLEMIYGCTVIMKYGYGSKNDGTVIQFELCDECAEKIIKDFTYPCNKSEEL